MPVGVGDVEKRLGDRPATFVAASDRPDSFQSRTWRSAVSCCTSESFVIPADRVLRC